MDVRLSDWALATQSRYDRARGHSSTGKMHIDEDLLVGAFPGTALDPALQLARNQIVN